MIVTLLTDFGLRDPFVAEMKGVILGRSPGARLVDATHEIPPGDVRAAAFALLTLYPAFPAGTVHLVVVDPGVWSERRALVVAAAGQLFVGPDNGLFSHVLEREPEARIFRITREDLFRQPVSPTFHGRDVFAPVSAALACGVEPAEVGVGIPDPVRLRPLRPRHRPGGGVEGHVEHVDRFGNCVTTLRAEDLADLGSTPVITVGRHRIRQLRRYFSEPGGRAGEPFALWGSSGFLELAVDGDSAARLLGARRDSAVTATAS